MMLARLAGAQLAPDYTLEDQGFAGGNSTTFTTSTVFYEAVHTTSVSERLDQFSTRVIGRLAGGSVVYDQTFSVPFSDSTMQAALVQTTNALVGAGAMTFIGPTLTSNLQALVSSSSNTVQNSSQTNPIIGTYIYPGPYNLVVGDLGSCESYTLLTNSSYAIPMGLSSGSPQLYSVQLGVINIDVETLNRTDIYQTTTVTNTYLTTQVYELVGTPSNVSQADLSLNVSAAPDPVGMGSNLVYSLTVSNAGPDAATGVVISNQLPAGVNFVSATGGATPSGGVLLLNLGSLTNGAVTNAQVIVQPTVAGRLTNSFQVLANETDPDLTNNSVAVASTVTNAPTSGADLSISASGGWVGIIGGYYFTYNLSITNLGPDTATGVVVSNQIPAGVNFYSATGGVMPTNGVLRFNLGSLTIGATNLIQITVQQVVLATNVFQVSANETDPVPANNTAIIVTNGDWAATQFTLSTAEYDTNHLTTVNETATNYTTELVARMPDGTVLYDHTFNVAYSDAAVQAGVSQAGGLLSAAGATAYSGPTLTSLLPSVTNSSVTVTSVTTNVIVGTKTFVGPVTFPCGVQGRVQGYTFDPVVTNYVVPVGGNLRLYTLLYGDIDVDTMIFTNVDTYQTTTNATTYLNSAVYEMTGIVSQADLSVSANAAPNPVGVGSNLVYSLTVSNAGPDAATGVVISNQLPAGVNFVSATGGATPSGGVLLLNLGSLTNGAVTNCTSYRATHRRGPAHEFIPSPRQRDRSRPDQ